MNHNLSANRLQLALREKEMSAAELSRQSGLSRSHISHYVNGTHSPGNIAAKKMADVLGVSPVWLMGFEGINKNGDSAGLDERIISAFHNADEKTQKVVLIALGLE